MGDVSRQWDYIISFNTKAQYRAVIRILKGHNERVANPHKHAAQYVRHHVHEKYKRISPGNELWALDLVTFKKGWRVGDQASPAYGPALARGVVFSNTGDNAQKNRTFDFLNWHLLRTMSSVYHDSFPAIACYVCDDTVMQSLESRDALDEATIHCTAEPVPEDPMELVQPAFWITRKIEGNPAYRELMMNEEPGNEPRRKRMRQEPTVIPFLSNYAIVEDGWVVNDQDGCGEYFDKDSRERAEDHARLVHAIADADGVEDEAGEVVD